MENNMNPQPDRELAERFKNIPGWGMDADPENDPTYPMKHWTGADHQRFEYERPPQQPVDMEILHSNERPDITRVFGTSSPPKGLSGSIRRYAYAQYSEGQPLHWMTLVLADRVNVVEGIIEDLKAGIIPNLWVERGWRSEWKHNRNGMIKKIAVTAAVTTVLLMVLSGRKKRKYSR